MAVAPKCLMNWQLTYCTICSLPFSTCFKIPPYPKSDASVSTTFGRLGLAKYKQGISLTVSFINLTALVCSSVQGTGTFLSLSCKGFCNPIDIRTKI